MTSRIIAAIALLLALTPNLGADSPAETLSPERQRELAQTGLNAFDEAIDAVRKDPARAEDLYRKAAAAFETLAEHGVAGPALEYDLANAYFRLGEIGRAVLHYRRGLASNPRDAALRANLEYARNRVEPFIKPGGSQRLVSRLTSWTHDIPAAWNIWFTALCSIVGWLCLALWLKRRTGGLLAGACVSILLSLACAGSTLWRSHDLQTRPHAVVIEGANVLRLGRGQGYDPALTQPLGPGVELRVLSERADWVEVRLVDGLTGWLPAEAIEKL